MLLGFLGFLGFRALGAYPFGDLGLKVESFSLRLPVVTGLNRKDRVSRSIIACMCLYVYMYVYIYIYMYTHRVSDLAAPSAELALLKPQYPSAMAQPALGTWGTQ